VTISRHSETPPSVWPLTLAGLRFGVDTRAARLLKDLSPKAAAPGPELIERLADALGLPSNARREQVRQAWLYAESSLALGAAHDLVPIPWFHEEYPPLLREIADPPIVLWRAGSRRALDMPAVAIVGSRRATPAGLAVARRLAAGLADAGLVIVSGLALGIDGAAHEGALSAGGTTVAVLGCGADVVYPRAHRDLMARVRGSGAVFSEFPPGMPPRAHYFPLRNRIISGLCRAVIVAEASMRSGSLITARMALEQGRDVLAVPGSVASGQFSGCHALIKDGAPLVETVEDVLRTLGCAVATGPVQAMARNPTVMSRLEEEMAVGETYSVDDLAQRTGLAAHDLLAELGALELAGIVDRVPGAGFVKLDKSVIGEGHG
jgi:DNA processing protein